MTQIRYIRHDAEHTDKEHLLTDDDGNEVWAVVECGLILPKGENMATSPERRLELLRQMGVTITPEMVDKEYKHSLDTIERTYGKDWEKDADALHKLLHDEVKTTCENCDEGKVYSIYRDEHFDDSCDCCNGDWQHCPNCTEGTGSHNADDVRADMRGHL